MTYDVKAARRAAKVRKVASLAACPKCGADKGAPCEGTAGNHRERVTVAGRVNQAARELYSDRYSSNLGARDHYGRELDTTGNSARYGGVCPRCPNDLTVGRIVRTSRGWMHAACAPGADDE